MWADLSFHGTERWLTGNALDVRVECSESLDECCIPIYVVAFRSRNESSSTWSFAVVSDQAWWFLRAKGSPHDVVHGEVACGSPRRSFTSLLGLRSHRSGIGEEHKVRTRDGGQPPPARPRCSNPVRTRPQELSRKWAIIWGPTFLGWVDHCWKTTIQPSQWPWEVSPRPSGWSGHVPLEPGSLTCVSSGFLPRMRHSIIRIEDGSTKRPGWCSWGYGSWRCQHRNQSDS